MTSTNFNPNAINRVLLWSLRKTQYFMQTGALTLKHPPRSLNPGQKIAGFVGKCENGEIRQKAIIPTAVVSKS